jgi:glycosyltransferase involved in cell wall biosynthesis
MKVLHICDFAGNLGNAIRILKIRDYLSRENEVQFINVASAYKPQEKLLLHPHATFRIIRRRVGSSKRRLTDLEARIIVAEDLLRAATKHSSPDIIWSEGPVGAAASIRMFGESIPVVADMHGIGSAENANGTGSETVEYEKSVEALLFSKSFRVIVVSKPMKDYLLEVHGVDRERISVIANGSEVRQERARYREPHRAIFGGIFADWEDPDSYLDLAKRDQRIEFYLAGTGPLENHIRERIRKERIGIHYLGSLDYDAAINVFASMTVGLAPSSDTLARKVACPIKVFDYLSCGLPVITVNVGEWAEIVSNNRCGFVTEKSDAEEFDRCLRLLDKPTWEGMSANGLRLIANQYNWNRLLGGIDEILRACR